MDLRSTISALTEQAEAGEVLTPPVEEIKPVETQETPEIKEGRTAGRDRDEKGRLLPGKAAEAKTEIVERAPRPSSWKKEMWEHWDKLDPNVAAYINQREGEYAKGVSTYKTEWEQAKPYLDAMAPHLPDLQKAGIAPAQAIARLASAHKELVSGNPQQKLQSFARLAQQYGVPLQALYDSNFAQQFQQQQALQQQQQPQETAEQAAKRVYMELRAQEGVHEFGSRKDGAGSPLYPHFETVRPKMAQLLEAGLAEDLEGAYRQAVKLDDELWKSEQESKAKAEETAKLEAQRKAVSVAKGNAISPKSSTPASTGAGAKKGLRAQLEQAFDEHTAGRV